MADGNNSTRGILMIHIFLILVVDSNDGGWVRLDINNGWMI
jgi:hypothetical protein